MECARAMFSLVSSTHGEHRFMKDLKDKCTSEPGNRQFWAEIRTIGRRMSLISDKEAEDHGGTSDVSESGALKVCYIFYAFLHAYHPQVP